MSSSIVYSQILLPPQALPKSRVLEEEDLSPDVDEAREQLEPLTAEYKVLNKQLETLAVQIDSFAQLALRFYPTGGYVPTVR